MTSKLPTDPLADASTGVVRRSRGAFLKTAPQPERRRPTRDSRYTGPERRKEDPKPPEEAEAEESSRRLFGQPRWLVISAAIYAGALALALLLIFTY